MIEKVIKKRRQKQLLLRVAAVALLGLPGAALGQAQPEAIQAVEPPFEGCTGRMADGSGVDVVMAMAFTADGTNVLLGCKSGTVELRSLEGQLRFRQQPKMHHVQRVGVTPDGRVMLMLSGNTIHLWSASGASLGRIDTTVCEGCSTNTMVVSPDGASVLTGHDDASAVLWSMKGNRLRRFEDPNPMESFGNRVVELAFDPAGTGISVGHGNGIVRRWTTGGRLLGEIDTAIDTLKALAITPGGDVLAAGWYGAKRWNAQGRAQDALREEGAIEALQLLPEGNSAVLAGSHVDNFLEIRDLQGQLLLTLHNHDRSSSPDGPLAVSPDGRVLVVADDNQLYRWDLPSATPTPPNAVLSSP